MNRTVITIIAVTFAAAFAGGLYWRAGPQTTAAAKPNAQSTPALGDLSARVAALPTSATSAETRALLFDLTAALSAQADRQQEMANQIAALERQLTAVSEAPLRNDEGKTAAEIDDAFETALNNGASPVDDSDRLANRRFLLIDSGLPEDQADAVIDYADRLALARVNLRYTAAREGWLNSAEYYRKRRELPNDREQIRQEFGDDAYDSYLYATRQGNRVVINSVLRNSAAAQAGLRSGDMVVGYDGRPVYRLDDLMKYAAEGTPDESVPVSVLRDGEQLQVFAPRGPLGFNAGQTSINPREAR